MGKDLPKGLLIFAVILFVGAFWTGSVFFTPNSKMILLGKSFSGPLFRIYYLCLGILNLVIAVGIFKLRRWSYVSFKVLTGYFILTSILNMLFTQHETLVLAGWKISENGMSSFYFIQGYTITFSLILFAWLFRYRKLLIR